MLAPTYISRSRYGPRNERFGVIQIVLEVTMGDIDYIDIATSTSTQQNETSTPVCLMF